MTESTIMAKDAITVHVHVHAQYSTIFSTTKRLLKDLHIKGIQCCKIMAPSYIRLDLHVPPLQLLGLLMTLSLYFFQVKVISHNNGCSESCNYFKQYPICRKQTKILTFFLFFTLDTSQSFK